MAVERGIFLPSQDNDGTYVHFHLDSETSAAAAAFLADSDYGEHLGWIMDNDLESKAVPYWDSLITDNDKQTKTGATPLTLPTVHGDVQGYHPSVWDAGAGLWNGSRYWMAYTPFTDGDVACESPSIVCSDDGLVWDTPADGGNPIFAATSGYYADTELVKDPAGDLWCVWLHAGIGDSLLLASSSSDGVDWTTPVTILAPAAGLRPCLSPAIIWDGSQFVMWIVNGVSAPYVIQRRTCATVNGTWSAPTNCTAADSVTNMYHWHIGVTLDSGTYYMALLNTYYGELWLYTSADGLTWTKDATPIIRADRYGCMQHNLYRASIILDGSTMRMWYSGARTIKSRIAYTTFTV